MSIFNLSEVEILKALFLSMAWGLFLGFLLTLMKEIFFSWLDRKGV